MKKLFFLISLFSVIVIFAGCGKQPETISVNEKLSYGTTLGALDLSGTIDATLLAIKNKDLASLSQFVGPQGLRFSPYEYVNVGTDIVLDADTVKNGLLFPTTFIRGSYDGTGEPIDLTIGQYREKFVYNADFINAPEVYHNQKFQRGNTINNIFDIYTGKEIVEYHFPYIDPQFEGMDWRSLYLVFENVGGQRYLIGIINGQRTI